MPEIKEAEELEIKNKIEDEIEFELPPMFKVVMINDDYTPVEFVLYLLITVFQKNQEEAFKLMKDVHDLGRGCIAIYPKDIAETKLRQAKTVIEQNQEVLNLILEKE